MADWRAAPRRLAVVVGFLALVGMALVQLVTPPASAYEMSIYEAYPWYFWALAMLALFLGQYAIVSSALGERPPRDAWRYGFVLVVAVSAMLLFLPYFRGYPVFGRADVLTHVGYIHVIQETGMVSDGNVYPNVHLFILSLAYATGIEPLHVINSFSGFVSLFSIAASFALARSVYGQRTALVVLPFLTLFIGGTSHVNPSPYSQSTLLVPFVLYLLVKEQESRSIAIRATLALVLVSTVIYHPLTTLFLLFVFGIYAAVRPLSEYLAESDRTGNWPNVVGPTAVTQIALAVFFVWYSSYLKILTRVESVITTLLYPESGGQSTFDSYTNTVSQTSPALVDVLRIGLIRYGQSMILLSLAGLYALWMGYRLYRRRRQSSSSVYELTFAAAFVLFSGLSVLFLVFDLVVGFGRPLLYARLFGALLVGSLFWTLYQSTRWKRVVKVTLYVSIAALVVVGTFGLYYSPYEISVNQQVTEAELEGSEWFLQNRATSIPAVEYGIDLYRFRDARYGTSGYSEDLIVDGRAPTPPDHFNYTVHGTLGESYERDHYMLITSQARVFYPEMYPDYRDSWRFTPTDFARIETDPTVGHVYDASGFDVYTINGTRLDAAGN